MLISESKVFVAYESHDGIRSEILLKSSNDNGESWPYSSDFYFKDRKPNCSSPSFTLGLDNKKAFTNDFLPLKE